jgi:excisionase family DNA binding protein
MTAEKEFYSIEDFAALLNLHPNTIRTSIKKGRLNAFRIGVGKTAAWRISRSEINRIAEMDMEIVIEQIIEQRTQQ